MTEGKIGFFDKFFALSLAMNTELPSAYPAGLVCLWAEYFMWVQTIDPHLGSTNIKHKIISCGSTRLGYQLSMKLLNFA